MLCCGCLETSCLLLWTGFPPPELRAECQLVSVCVSVCGPQRQSSSLKHHHNTDDIMFPVCRLRTATTMRRWCRWTGTTSWTSSSNRWDVTARSGESRQSCDHCWFSCRGRCLQWNKDTKVSFWGRCDRKPRNQNVLAAMERAQDSGCTPRSKISAKADKEVMTCKITLTL